MLSTRFEHNFSINWSLQVLFLKSRMRLLKGRHGCIQMLLKALYISFVLFFLPGADASSSPAANIAFGEVVFEELNYFGKGNQYWGYRLQAPCDFTISSALVESYKLGRGFISGGTNLRVFKYNSAVPLDATSSDVTILFSANGHTDVYSSVNLPIKKGDDIGILFQIQKQGLVFGPLSLKSDATIDVCGHSVFLSYMALRNIVTYASIDHKANVGRIILSTVPTGAPLTVAPTSSPISGSPTLCPLTCNPSTLNPSSISPTNGPTTASPSVSPSSKMPTYCPTSLSPLTRSPTSTTPSTSPLTNSPSSKTPSRSPSTCSPSTLNPSCSPSCSPSTRGPTTTPTSNSPSSKNPTSVSPSSKMPTCCPTSLSPLSSSPSTLNPSCSPSCSPSSRGPTTTPTSNSPSSKNPTSVSPSSKMPTCCPTSLSPLSSSPSTLNPSCSPTSCSPSSRGPTTTPTSNSPSSKNPTSVSPSSKMPTCCPTSLSPLSSRPTTCGPTTGVPTTCPTNAPLTAHPGSQVPSRVPSTCGPTTCTPSTCEPTHSPSTLRPSYHPTSAHPLTNNPTEAPTTASPSTSSPTSIPTSCAPTTCPSNTPLTTHPASQVPSRVPTTCGPTTCTPSTCGPTGSPSSLSPSSLSPSYHPTSAHPFTNIPTEAPTTASPSTSSPTSIPTSCGPTTCPSNRPLTTHPGSQAPTTCGPTTCTPSTCGPTGSPSSLSPSSLSPSYHPTSAHPFTHIPTEAPTTAGPFTSSPTSIPTSGPTTCPTKKPLTASQSPSQPPTTVPSTFGPSMAPTSTPVRAECLVLRGALEVWVQTGLTVQVEVQCEYPGTLHHTWRLNSTTGTVLSAGSSQVSLSESQLLTILGTAATMVINLVLSTTNPPYEDSTVYKTHNVRISRQIVPQVTITVPQPFHVGVSSTISATITHHYPNISSVAQQAFTYQWSLFRVASSSRSGGRVGTGRLYGDSTTQLLVLGQTLDPKESYQVKFWTNMRSFYGKEFNHQSTFTTEESKLEVVIAGGSERMIPFSEKASLNGQGSYDPDHAPNSVLSYAWSCLDLANGSACDAFYSSTNVVKTASILELPSSVLPSGASLSFTLTFTVVSNDATLTRTAARSGTVFVSSAPIPSVKITTAKTTIPLSGILRLTAEASPASSSTTLPGGLLYNWSYVGEWNRANGSTSLVVPASMVGAGFILFTVEVKDPYYGSKASTSIEMEIARPPLINSLVVWPNNGTALTTLFSARCSAVSFQIPLLYAYKYRLHGATKDTQLTSHLISNELSTTLPVGNFTILAEVMDSLGGVSSESSQNIESNPAATAVVSAESIQDSLDYQCNSTKRVIMQLRTIVASSNAVAEADRLDVVTACEQMVSTLRVSGRYDEMLRLISYALTVVEAIPDSTIKITDCAFDIGFFGISDNNASSPTSRNENKVRHTSILQASSSSTPSTFQHLARALWKLFNKAMREHLDSIWVTQITGSAQTLQVMDQLTASDNAVDATHDDVKLLVNTTRDVVDSTASSELEGNNGNTAINVLSNIVEIVSNTTQTSNAPGGDSLVSNSSDNEVRCQTLTIVNGMVDKVLKKFGENLVPGETSSSYNTNAFSAEVQAVFSADRSEIANANTHVAISKEEDSDTGARSRAIVTVNSYSKGFDGCLPVNGQGSIESALTSINLIPLSPNSINSQTTTTSSPTASPNTLSPVFAGGSSPGIGPTNSPSASASNGGLNVSIDLQIGLATSTLTPDVIFREVWSRSGEGECKGGSQRKLTCQFWDPVKFLWSEEGCAFAGVVSTKEKSSTSVTCQCSHLTEFAIIAQQQSCEKDVSPVYVGLYWIFIVPTCIFVALFFLSILQAARLRIAKQKNNFVLRTHLMMAAQCAARLVSCFLLSALGPGFSIRSLHKVGILFVIVLPYSLTYLAYTYNAFQWISIIHNASMSRNPFAKWWPLFNGVNFGVIVLALILFSLFLFGGYPEMVYVGSFVLAFLSLTIGVIVQLYGLKISRVMLKSAGGKKAKARTVAKSKQIFKATGCMGGSMILQSALYMTSPFMSGVNLVALTLAFHVCEALSVSALTYLHWATVSSLVTKSRPKIFLRASSRSKHGRKRSKFQSRLSNCNNLPASKRGSMSLGGSKYSSSKIGESRGGLLQDSVVKRSSKVISKSSASVKVVSKANFKIYDTPLANTPKDEKETPLTFVSEQAIDILDAGTRNPHRVDSSHSSHSFIDGKMCRGVIELASPPRVLSGK
ncbi:hypothetical protein AAMO2058_001109500 [Amorphochlora amoebiformis]